MVDQNQKQASSFKVSTSELEKLNQQARNIAQLRNITP
jgi:hypothetical protein